MKTPKTHQIEGAKLIASRRRCALWFKPRVGKTLSTVLGMEMLGLKNILVICPVTVIPVWQREFAERGWPESKACTGMKHQKIEASAYTAGPVICSFESAWRLPLNQRKWDAIIFDESIRLWNWQAKQVRYWYGNEHLTQCCVLLSGAPCPEGYLQLASQMIICRGQWFGHRDIYSYLQDFWHYNADRYKWECDDQEHLAEVKRRMNIVGLSKSLKDVGAQDEKLLSFMPVEPSIKVVALLRAIAAEELQPNIRALRNQMAANGLTGEAENILVVDGTKAEALCKYIEEQVEQEPDYACVIMCRFRAQVEQVARMLGAAMVHGGVTGKARQQAIDDFQAGTKRHIVCQEETAKMGIDLSRGKEIHYLSNSWSGDSRIQSQERCSNLNKAEPVGIVDWYAHEIECAIANAVRNKEDFQMSMHS